jgi:tetratricopeptide (TPR) repeat protein
MSFVSLRHCGYVALSLLAIAGSVSPRVSAQEKPQPAKAIDIDKELAARAPQNRALSYYHFSLAKWSEAKGDLTRALAEMRNALKYNDTSSAVRVELAQLMDKNGNTREAIEEAQEAARLDPKDAEPHWLLANIYSRSQGRGASAKEGLRKAVKELETLRDIAPTDERSYYALGGAYFELDEPEKAVQAYEKFQTLVTNIDAGYREIAKYYDRIANQAVVPDEKNKAQEKAIEYLTKALQVQPNSTESLMALASLYGKLDKIKEAVPVYKKLLELTDDNTAVKRQYASTLVDAQEFDEALKVTQDLAKSMPQDPNVQILLGRSQLGAHHIPEAIETFKSILEYNPGQLEAEFYLGTAYEQNGQLAEAVKIFTGLLRKTEGGSEEAKANRTVFQQHLAADYQEMGENAKAIAIYEEMLKGEATPNPRVLFLLINAYRVNRQFDKALALGREQYEKNPKDSNIGLVYARALADAGRTKEGAEILNKMLLADPSNVDIYVNLSQVYLQGKKYSDAEKVLRRAEDRKLDSERVKFQLATIYERQKDFDRAESLFKEIIKGNPKNATALNYIGYMLADRGVRLEEAVRYVEEALALDPNNGAYLDSLGWAFFKLNELDKAEKYLLQAIDLVKHDPVIHDHLGDLYYKTGNFDKARDFWTRSVSTQTEPEEVQKVREKLEKLQEMLRRQKHRQ